MGRRIPDPVRRKVAQLLADGWQSPDIIALFSRGIPDFPTVSKISESTIRRITQEQFPEGLEAAREKNRVRELSRVSAKTQSA